MSVIDAGFPSDVMDRARPRTLLSEPFRVLGRMRPGVGIGAGPVLYFLQSMGIRPRFGLDGLPSPVYNLFLAINLPLGIWGRGMWGPRIEGLKEAARDITGRPAAWSPFSHGLGKGESLGEAISKRPCAMSPIMQFLGLPVSYWGRTIQDVGPSKPPLASPMMLPTGAGRIDESQTRGRFVGGGDMPQKVRALSHVASSQGPAVSSWESSIQDVGPSKRPLASPIGQSTIDDSRIRAICLSCGGDIRQSDRSFSPVTLSPGPPVSHRGSSIHDMGSPKALLAPVIEFPVDGGRIDDTRMKSAIGPYAIGEEWRSMERSFMNRGAIPAWKSDVHGSFSLMGTTAGGPGVGSGIGALAGRIWIHRSGVISASYEGTEKSLLRRYTSIGYHLAGISTQYQPSRKKMAGPRYGTLKGLDSNVRNGSSRDLGRGPSLLLSSSSLGRGNVHPSSLEALGGEGRGLAPQGRSAPMVYNSRTGSMPPAVGGSLQGSEGSQIQDEGRASLPYGSKRPPPLDLQSISDQIYGLIERRMRKERERRGW